MNAEQKELARKILDQVEAEPATLDMGRWEERWNWDRCDWKTGKPVAGCGTTRCVAGWAVHFSALSGERDIDTLIRLGHELYVPPAWVKVAAALLGLTGEEAEDLFFNDADEAVRILREYVEGP